ncbi:hypothetical protein XBP1_160023 [Xenorhabdus bovienii str. puntauvense]|uniref:Uncharacterized protein n=1 Tax=Xenorhabdus bovienii str. puntauvense TaxID=1398201 RepID=A0A077NC21_XENBV|nr:hypothetical protein [Xenorhabdus bovienii]CDG95813.1 hypothetical protein XBP1_160023 [Xenorhabdus bovienii str. puntauvense]
MKIMIETSNDTDISVVLDVVKGFIKKADRSKNDLYFVQTDGMAITLKETSAGNIIARVR